MLNEWLERGMASLDDAPVMRVCTIGILLALNGAEVPTLNAIAKQFDILHDFYGGH